MGYEGYEGFGVGCMRAHRMSCCTSEVISQPAARPFAGVYGL